MSEIHLGSSPARLGVHLATGADFLCTLRSNPTPWAEGTVITLVFGAQTWTATIAGNDAVFSVDKATADLIPQGTKARLVATNGTTDQVLALGRVVRYG